LEEIYIKYETFLWLTFMYLSLTLDIVYQINMQGNFCFKSSSSSLNRHNEIVVLESDSWKKKFRHHVCYVHSIRDRINAIHICCGCVSKLIYKLLNASYPNTNTYNKIFSGNQQVNSE
jgi:hypothetical protein